MKKKSVGLLLGVILAYFGGLFCLNFIFATMREPGTIRLPPLLWEDVMLLGFIAPILEELFFRDLFLRSLWGRTQKLFLSVVVSSLIFMIAHQSLYFGAFLLGFINAWLYWISRSVVTPMVFHSLSNLSWFFIPVCFPEIFRVLTDWKILDQFYR